MSGDDKGDRPKRRRGRGGLRAASAVFAVLSCLGLLWALASPVNGIPDEHAHIIKAAGVVNGQGDGIETVRPDGVVERVFIVPVIAGESEDLNCHRFVPELPAAACRIVEDQPVAQEGTVFARTGAASYNPVYYAIVGRPIVQWQGFGGIYLARAVNALLMAACFAAAAWCVWLLRRPGAPLLGVLAVATPAVMQYAGAVNPQGFEVAALTAFTAALLTALRVRPAGPRLWGLAAVLLVAGALGVQARALSWVWLGCIVLVCLVWAGLPRALGLVRRPPVLGAALAVAAACALASRLLLAPSFAQQQSPFWGAQTPPAEGFLFMLSRFFEFWSGMFALFAWNDTVDHWALHLYGALLVTLVLSALFFARALRRQRIAVGLAALLLFALPALVQAATVEQNGYIWQGRYALPLYALLVLVAAFTLAPSLAGLSPRVRAKLAAIVAVGTGLAQFTGFMRALTRNYIGERGRIVHLFRTPETFGQVPLIGNDLTVVAIAVLAIAFGLLVWFSLRPAPARIGRVASSAASSPVSRRSPV